MATRNVLLYFSWSRPDEVGAPLTVIDDRFPAVFELRRLFYPNYEGLADPTQVDPGIAGFLDHVQKPNFAAFAELAGQQSGHPVRQIERVADNGGVRLLDDGAIGEADTIIVVSFDSFRSRQTAQHAEIEAVRRFLGRPQSLICVCPHHDIGSTTQTSTELRCVFRRSRYPIPEFLGT